MKSRTIKKGMLIMMIGLLSAFSIIGCGEKSITYSGDLTLEQALNQRGTHIWYSCKADEDDFDYEPGELRSYTLTKDTPIYSVLVVTNGEVTPHTVGYRNSEGEQSKLSLGEVSNTKDEDLIGIIEKAEQKTGKALIKKYNSILKKGPVEKGKYSWGGNMYTKEDIEEWIKFWEGFDPKKMKASPYKIAIETDETGSSTEYEGVIAVDRYDDEKATPSNVFADWFNNDPIYGEVYDNIYQGFYRYEERGSGMCWVTRCEENTNITLDEPNKDKHLIDPGDKFDWDKWSLKNFDFLEK